MVPMGGMLVSTIEASLAPPGFLPCALRAMINHSCTVPPMQMPGSNFGLSEEQNMEFVDPCALRCSGPSHAAAAFTHLRRLVAPR